MQCPRLWETKGTERNWSLLHVKTEILLISAFILVILFTRYLKKPFGQAAEAPGPRGLPLVGNIFQAPRVTPWLSYQQTGREHGPFYKLQFGLTTVIMLGDHDTTRKLLDKRNNIYSSRPHLPFAGDCVTKGLYTVLMPDGTKVAYVTLYFPVIIYTNMVSTSCARISVFRSHILALNLPAIIYPSLT